MRSSNLARRVSPSQLAGEVYLKLTVIDDVLIVSFKELWIWNVHLVLRAELVHDTRDMPYTYKGESTIIPAVTGDFAQPAMNPFWM